MVRLPLGEGRGAIRPSGSNSWPEVGLAALRIALARPVMAGGSFSVTAVNGGASSPLTTRRVVIWKTPRFDGS